MSHRKRRSAFILAEVLLALFATLCLLPIVVAAFSIMSSFDLIDERLGDELALEKLKRELILANDFYVLKHELDFKSGEEEKSLVYDGKRLYLRPGYQLFLDNIQELSFIYENGNIFIYYLKDGIQGRSMLR